LGTASYAKYCCFKQFKDGLYDNQQRWCNSAYHAVAAEDARTRIIHAMEKTGWVQAKAARSLNLTPRQMGYALKKYKIDIKKL